MTRYVVGFLFADYSWGKCVALIRKSHPEWQRGKFNGIGGRIEPGEGPLAAMVREFREEAGCDDSIAWSEFAVLQDARGWAIHFFRATAHHDAHFAAEANTKGADEPIVICSVDGMGTRIKEGRALPNLGWLIPLALDPDVSLATVLEERSGERAAVMAPEPLA